MLNRWLSFVSVLALTTVGLLAAAPAVEAACTVNIQGSCGGNCAVIVAATCGPGATCLAIVLGTCTERARCTVTAAGTCTYPCGPALVAAAGACTAPCRVYVAGCRL